MSKHTPGPWTWDGQRGVPRHCCVAQVWRPDGMSLAMIEPTEDASEADANARLIAAAPDLLEALKNIVNSIEVHDDRAVHMALDAIAKAEGR